MDVLRKLPFSDKASSVDVSSETVLIRAYQIIVWVSLAVENVLSSPFPAVLDTGHSHNFSIRESQLAAWAGINLDRCPKYGKVLVNRQEVPLVGVNLWIHRNKPKSAQLLPKPVKLELPEGISVFPSDSAGAPRIPLLAGC